MSNNKKTVFLEEKEDPSIWQNLTKEQKNIVVAGAVTVFVFMAIGGVIGFGITYGVMKHRQK